MTEDEQATGESETTVLGQLKKKSREELLFLLEQLLEREPNIEPLVELLIGLQLATTMQEEKKPGKGRERTLDPSTIQRQVNLAFYHAGEGWNAASRAAAELEPLYDIGRGFAEAGEWANAQVVYATVARETIMQYEQIHDEGQLSWVLGECAAGLVECLDTQSTLPPQEQLDTTAREALLSALLDLWKFGHEYGGIEVDLVGAIARHATEQERKGVEVWLRQEIRSGQDFSSHWRNRYIVTFLVTLKSAESFSDEDILKEYRKVGLYKDLTEKLLQHGRANEAQEVARTELTEPTDVTWFAEQLIQSGSEWQGQALIFVETKLKEIERALAGKRQDFTASRTADIYRRWLGEKYSEYGKTEQALTLDLMRFQASPDETTYRSVRSAARLAGLPEKVWSDHRARLIEVVKQQERWGALVTIYLDEGEVDQALAALATMERLSTTSPSGYGFRQAPSQYQLQVARAAEEHYPEDAIRLYKEVVERLIEGRGRENYQQAVNYVARLKYLYEKQGHEAEWSAHITALRNKNKGLRALKEELEKRNL
ncbi:MAG TPA: hypothetical protein VEL31_11870 [Ktedonobacteraceae bacterium]|nr:hypothetical protein [Ktedonobacteraceae bacterium]